MKKTFSKVSIGVLTAMLVVFGTILSSVNIANAENDSTSTSVGGTSISISPVSKVLQLDASSTYEDIFSITNDGSEPINFEVYAAPYSYVYSEENDAYSLGFSKENNYTQITRWISIMDKNGKYVEKPTYTANPGETVDVPYKITTPSSIPDGGQYAVLFAHTISNPSSTGGIKTEASPGMVIYGRSNSQTIISSEISEMRISQTAEKEVDAEENGQKIKKSVKVNSINAFAKVKNTGNLDFNARGVLKVEGIFGGTYYETPDNESRISVIPESELILSDEWEDTPSFGIFKATWTVAAGENSETTEIVVCLISPSVIIGGIILLTALILCIIIMVRKRKERRSRFTS